MERKNIVETIHNEVKKHCFLFSECKELFEVSKPSYKVYEYEVEFNNENFDALNKRFENQKSTDVNFIESYSVIPHEGVIKIKERIKI